MSRALCKEYLIFTWQSNIENFLLHRFAKKVWSECMCLRPIKGMKLREEELEGSNFPKWFHDRNLDRIPWE